mmetsp:Transcript_13969/g.22111  ORF Transcript_13969/g.22111 Transcript_13969/m.22111 type:complete len:321 (-) Transcript_13969:149-1111(-)
MKSFSKISDAVVRVMGMNPSPTTLQGTNTYLVGSGGTRILIDTGEGAKGYMDNLLRAMEDVKCTNLQMVILTHYHYDHVGGVPEIREKFGKKIPIYKMPLASEPNLEDAEGALKSELEALALKEKQEKKKGEVTETIHVEDDGFLEIKSGMEFKTEGATLESIATPGHTPDHFSLYLKEKGALFSGDCILGKGSTVVGDLPAYMSSLQRLLALKPKVIYPGHGPVIEDACGKIKDYISHRNKRESQILKMLENSENPVTSMEIVRVVYAESTAEYLYPAANRNVTQHLKKLQCEKKATLVDGKKWKLASGTLDSSSKSRL